MDIGTGAKHLRLLFDSGITIAGTLLDGDDMNASDIVYFARQARLLASVANCSAVPNQWVGRRHTSDY